jgi:anti-sigma regulatory factor (Ser/Thr protein kinase)
VTTPLEYRARLPVDAKAPAAARRLVRCLEGEVASERLENIELLVTELVTNSVRHAGLDAEGWVGIELLLSPDRIHVEATDPGRGFDPANLPAEPEIRPSGWGLYLVDQLAQRWGVHHDAFTRVWFELELSELTAGNRP